MTIYEKSAIIGCYLNGAKPELIAEELGYSVEEVKKVIAEYKKNKR